MTMKMKVLMIKTMHKKLTMTTMKRPMLMKRKLKTMTQMMMMMMRMKMSHPPISQHKTKTTTVEMTLKMNQAHVSDRQTHLNRTDFVELFMEFR